MTDRIQPTMLREASHNIPIITNNDAQHSHHLVSDFFPYSPHITQITPKNSAQQLEKTQLNSQHDNEIWKSNHHCTMTLKMCLLPRTLLHWKMYRQTIVYPNTMVKHPQNTAGTPTINMIKLSSRNTSNNTRNDLPNGNLLPACLCILKSWHNSPTNYNNSQKHFNHIQPPNPWKNLCTQLSKICWHLMCHTVKKEKMNLNTSSLQDIPTSDRWDII